MAKLEDNTKRRSNELEEQSITPRPPPKKRFLSSRASSPEEDPEENEDASDTFKEPLEAFRKDAIMRQWKDYIRSVKNWKKYIEQAELKKLENEDSFRLWEEAFKKLQVFLSNIIHEGMISFGQNSNTAMDIDSSEFNGLLEQSWATELTPNMLNAYKKKEHYDVTISKLNQLIDSWITKRENMTTNFKSVLDQSSLKDVQRDHERVLLTWVNGQKSLQDMKSRCKYANFKYLMLSEELRILNDRLETAESNLYQTQQELEKVKIQNNIQKEDTKVLDISSIHARPSIPATSMLPPTLSSSTVNAETEGALANYSSPGVAQNPLTQIQQLLEQKLRDIELIKEDRIAIKQQIARLEMDHVCVPESRIYKAPICRQLSQSRAYHKDKCNRLTDICHDLQNGLNDLLANRRRLIKDLDSEQVDYFKGLEDQLKKLDIDLTRIRGQRDASQMSLEECKAANEGGRVSIAELKVIADTRKERISYLETEVLRLQKKMAAKIGVKEYYELLVNSNGQEPFLTPVENELNTLQEQVEQMKSRIYQDIPKETVDFRLSQIVELKQLELDVTAFEKRYGFHPSYSLDDKQVQNILQDRIEKEKKIISESKEKILSLEATEKQLLSEIESVGKAYNELEEENMNGLKELSAAEDEVIKLQTERVKYSQTFTALNKSKDAHAMVANALSKQNEKQLAHVKQMNEHEKNLNNQLTCLERELNTSNSVYEIYKQKREEAKMILDELKEKNAFSKDKIIDLQKSILDKIRLIEDSAYMRLRLEESSEILKRKIDSTNKVDRPAEARLRKEREEYRSLLNCSSCRIRLKSHIILKCMHTFCKECLESKKRCPTCNESFGAHDVKQFYF
ncbi:uncharacterized protein BX663DRAFT_498987 [Cokeromyces recurvatus]|uniref:uncharacterized protein n=1 Tax=Cokeromyces recurvatus TaxID=90255 RepID=UPI00221FDAAC|nr:uncharacterized protein BX663DRAFT_498987 [Cokeromyces recurvatus]KAI7906149.1 hypothetical protein BX663DRAFT_498987 [Cokeromyces recurvatus]